MKKLAIFLVVFFLTLKMADAQAQNRYHPDEASGITIQAGALVAKEVTSYAGVATLTLNGRFDLGIAYSTPHDKTGSGRQYLWHEVTPFVGFSILRPRNDSPLGLDIGASHTTVHFNEEYDDTRSGEGHSFGLSGYWLIQDEGGITMLPRLELSYLKVQAQSQPIPEFPPIVNSVESVLIGVELSVLINETFIVAPAIAFFDGSSTLALMAGLAFP